MASSASPASASHIVACGIDNTNLPRALLVNAAGRLQVDVITQPAGGSNVVAAQGARDSTVQNWYAELRTSGGVSYDARDRNWTITETLAVHPTRIQDESGATMATVTAGKALKVDGSAVTQPISAASLPLPTGAAQEHVTAASPHAVRLTDGAAFYDAAKTGQLPSALVGARLDVNNGAWLGSTAPTVAQKTMANSIPVVIASDQTVIPVSDNSGSLTVDNAGTFAIQDSEKLVDNAAFTDGTTKVMPAGLIFDEVAGTALTENDIGAARMDSKRAAVYVIEDTTTRGQRAAVSAANALKVDGSAVTQPVSIAAAIKVNVEPETSGGLTISRVISAASTNATSIKASAGQVYGWYISNTNAAVRYVKLYNKASAPTVGTDTPVMTLAIPPNGAANVEFTNGIAFATGIALAMTTGAADSDATAVAANEVIAHILYK